MKLFGNTSHRDKTGADHACADTAGKHRTTEKSVQYAAKSAASSEAAANQAVQTHRRKKRGGCLTALCVFAVLVLGVVAAYKIWVTPPPVGPTDGPVIAASPSIQPGPQNTPNSGQPTEPPASSDDPATPTDEPKTGRRDNVWTFMLVGKDQVSGSTDTLMVGMLDVDSGKLNVVSVPRDTCVNVSWGVKKVNSILSARNNDIEGLRDGITDLLGYKVDHYAVVDLSAFVKIVDAIGGVYYDVPYYMDYDDPTQDLSIHFNKGYQWLSGSDALKVVRWRQNNDGTNYGDIGRINNQQAFLMTVAKQILQVKNIPNITTIIDIVEESVDTSLTSGNIMWFAERFVELDPENISFGTIPGNYNDYISGGSYVTIDVDQWLNVINEKLNPFHEVITEENVNILTKDANGNIYSTTGEIAGGLYSFYNYNKN